ncbi:protein kinase [Streptomyces sp. Je 1-79]|uniref:serine/threonine-protein kinase n=1 Tax=Streptomyces sp. Je 1-79 TaxID=2943847 RepID=UPI0021A5E536|nr:serine/threonine protein kinase [Streptomyces sp. Je 1-79]MCT4356461.1 protein kinase [Streptomyces sp. Je 1-79]
MAGANGAELVGEVLGGRYRVTATIGRGGMGVVARAVDQVLHREVAVKVLRAYTDASPAELADLRSRMQREAQAAARVRHSGVVTVHDVVEERGLPVIVMELVDGPSLDDVVTERGPLDPREVAAIGAKLMDALSAAHQAGVLHRDVKPGNVLLERSGRVVLTDFGIATMEATDGDAVAKLTQSGQIVGSLDYLPPERAQGREPGPASDIWSLGMTLYAAVEGTAPFRRTSAWSTLSAIVTEPLPEPRRSGPLAPVLRALMAKDPAHRPDAAQARAMLEAVATGAPPAPAPHAAPTPAPAPAPAPHPAPAPPQVQAQAQAPHPAAPPAFGPPPEPFAPQPGTAPGAPAGHDPRAEAPTGTLRGRRRRTRTVVAVAAATVLTGGGIAYALMDKAAPDTGGASQAAAPGASTPADGDMSGTGGLTDAPTAPGDLTSMTPDGTPTGTPTEKDEPGGPTPTKTPTADDKPATTPSAPPKTTPSATVKEPTPVSTACTGWAHSNRSDGYGYLAENSHLYTGPYAECSYVTAVKADVKVYYHCYVTNAYGNTWIYARIQGTETEGWLHREKADRETGSLGRC